MPLSRGAADMDDARARQILVECLGDASQRLVIEGVHGFIDDQPWGRMQQGARECQRLLFAVAQLPVPPPGLVEQRYETMETHPPEDMRECAAIEARDVRWVGEDLAQRAGRQIARTWNEEHDFSVGPRDAPRAPRPQPGERPEQQRFSGAAVADDQHVLAGVHLDMRFLETGAAAVRGDLELVDDDFSWRAPRRCAAG